jgi:hypothetical protein
MVPWPPPAGQRIFRTRRVAHGYIVTTTWYDPQS